ncbi:MULTISPECIES: RcnB family protein [unclassified Novosphingobium]|uniref:RcnB family protein n=1 Tax=Novosphingobium TaxID=165696 RepID=UPI00144865A3|nr:MULTISPECIES: RcnB family protein [unclassified Novosphingobium]NKJ44735.1 Ni/Co efflux regulator RcnB [Novosphingobium sp. SG720]NMN06500.1 Ni/Co efflux regulator RcnB [Novosphingobium sp. SG919]NMN89052.1 Ni/Co efflux regulator RcnB [Novosphingobium sp. SG916]
MNKLSSALIALAITLPAATPALAQHRDDRHDDRRGPAAHGPARPGPNRMQAGNPFRKGQRFEARRAPNYRVVDYRQYRRLGPPPRGYHWVRSGNDALLVAIGTGVIASVIANNF